METSARMLEADDRANELYWGSDRSVNQIAEDLDLSKGALYGMIRPLPAALGCPACGGEVAHPNRTAKERGIVDCPACGWDGTEDETIPGYAPVAVEDGRSPERSLDRGRTLSLAEMPRGAMIGGALLGAAVGVALLVWARRR